MLDTLDDEGSETEGSDSPIIKEIRHQLGSPDVRPDTRIEVPEPP